jgi:hypothetical protein
MKKRLLVAVLILLGAAAAWQIFQRISPSPVKSPAGRGTAIAVETAPVTTGPITEEGIFTGTLLPESQYTVAPKVAGKLEKILVNIGDRVTRNQRIALQDDAEYLQQLDQAKAELDVAVGNVEDTGAPSASGEGIRTGQGLREKKIVPNRNRRAEAQSSGMAKRKVAEAGGQKRRPQGGRRPSGILRIRSDWDGGPTPVSWGTFSWTRGHLAANPTIATILRLIPLTAGIYVIERDYPSIRRAERPLQTDPSRKDLPRRHPRIAPLLKDRPVCEGRDHRALTGRSS